VRSLTVAAILTVLSATHAWSQISNPQSDHDTPKVWRASDDCAKKAFRQYPDYNRESNLKRDRAFRICLATSGLPPRADLAAPAPAESGAGQQPGSR
jgi:hypothetical protein